MFRAGWQIHHHLSFFSRSGINQHDKNYLREKGLFGSTCQGSVHLEGDAKVAGTLKWLIPLCSQLGSREPRMQATSVQPASSTSQGPGTPVRGMVPPSVKMGLSTPTNVTKVMWHRHAQETGHSHRLAMN